MSNVDEREAEREGKLKEDQQGQRLMMRPEDYLYDMAQEAFWNKDTFTLYSEKAVDASIPIEFWRVEVTEPPAADPNAPPRRGRPAARRERLIPPSQDISRIETDRFVEGSTWWPGQDRIIHDWFIDKNGFYRAKGRRAFNTYRSPPETTANPADASRWVDHVMTLWPDPTEHEYFFDYCAHMLQRPEQKCNTAIIVSGTQGIGKDAALKPLRAAIGDWNSTGIEPDALFSSFQPWKETVMLVIDEARASKDDHQASSVYNMMKPLIAAPPDLLPLNEKYAKVRYVKNVMRVFVTTNDWMAMYIPAEDRRIFVLHSRLQQKWHEAAGDPAYFDRLFDWIDSDEAGPAVAAWLMARDISAFKPKAQSPRTAIWGAVTASWGEADDEVAAALDRLGQPDVFFGTELLDSVPDSFDASVLTPTEN